MEDGTALSKEGAFFPPPFKMFGSLNFFLEPLEDFDDFTGEDAPKSSMLMLPAGSGSIICSSGFCCRAYVMSSLL